jgi:hypothetical protein
MPTAGDDAIDGENKVEQHDLPHRRREAEADILAIEQVRSWVWIHSVMNLLRGLSHQE